MAKRLRSEILGGAMPPGTRLNQSEVAKRLGVSTTPVREAMRELAAEGLLDGDPHKGRLVHEPSLDELLEVYELRAVLEPMSARRAARRMSAQSMAQAETLVTHMEGLTDSAEWVQLNSNFHEILREASGSPRLVDFLRNLQNISSLYVGLFAQQTPERLAQANRQHREMLTACRDGDGERAAAIVRRHVDASLAIVRGLLTLEGDERDAGRRPPCPATAALSDPPRP